MYAFYEVSCVQLIIRFAILNLTSDLTRFQIIATKIYLLNC